MKDLLTNIAQSKHTSIAGIVILVVSIAEIWFPQYKEQLGKTRELAMSYGLVMAAQIGNGKGVASPPVEAASQQQPANKP